jgi:hypothetical protein
LPDPIEGDAAAEAEAGARGDCCCADGGGEGPRRCSPARLFGCGGGSRLWLWAALSTCLFDILIFLPSSSVTVACGVVSRDDVLARGRFLTSCRGTSSSSLENSPAGWRLEPAALAGAVTVAADAADAVVTLAPLLARMAAAL